MDQNAHGRRPHYHRGRRGQDRRGGDRRTQPAPQPESSARETREHVDVEQIMREIRARIAKGSGVDLTNQQIQELAARRLEAILDPRTIKPALLDQLRRGPSAADLPAAAEPPSIEIAEESLFDSWVRRLLRPLFATFAPILQAFKTQNTINRDTADRQAAAARRQAEWNALQYELLQKVVTESSRAAIEMQSLALRIDSLAAKVDFNERRVRAFEAVAPAPRPPRHHEPAYQPPPRETAAPPVPPQPPPEQATPGAAAAGEPSGDGARKRRRRRRGRRSGAGPGAGFAGVAGTAAAPSADTEAGGADNDAELDLDEPSDDEPPMQTVPAGGSEHQDPSASEAVEPPPAPPAPLESQTWAPAPAPESPSVAPAPAPEQPTPPRDEAAPVSAAEPPPPLDPHDPGPIDR